MKVRIPSVKVNAKTRKIMGSFGIFGIAGYLIFMAFFINSCVKEAYQDPAKITSPIAATIVGTSPANFLNNVAINPVLTVTFKNGTTSEFISAITLSLKQGLIPVAGTLTFKDTTLTFTPSSPLLPNTMYLVTISSGAKYSAGNAIYDNYNWSFTTAAATDVAPSTVLSVLPVNSATAVAVNGNVTATFSEAMNSATITSTTFTLKQGTTTVAGSVAYSGTTATFTPTSSLAAGTVYTGTITTGAKDVAGNAMASNFSWSFTTATATDVTPPTVLSVLPSNSATAVAVNGNVTATFSETMNSATITSTTFTLKQGTTTVAGSVAYSGTTATFTPTSSLAAGTVYTGTITTGAKDAAGNAMASNFSWSFTTAAAGLSFANDVISVLTKCGNCHTHGWTKSTVASTFYTNLVNAGYVNATNYTSSKIYIKLNSGHPGSNNIPTADTDKIINWMKEGSKNN
jgi:hypothetical protein